MNAPAVVPGARFDAHPQFASVVRHCPRWKFRRIDNLPGFSDKSWPYLVMLLIGAAHEGNLALAREPVEAGLLKVHYLSSFNLPVGYVLEIARHRLTVRDNHVAVIRRDCADADFFEGVEVQFSNAHFSIFNAQERAMLVALNRTSFMRLSERE